MLCVDNLPQFLEVGCGKDLGNSDSMYSLAEIRQGLVTRSIVSYFPLAGFSIRLHCVIRKKEAGPIIGEFTENASTR